MNTFIRFPEGKSKAFTLSYDDGVRQDKRFVKILNKYGLKSTFNLNSGCFEHSRTDEPENQKGRMCAEEALELYGEHEIAIHSLTHPYLDKLPSSQMVYEIMEDRLNLEKLFGRIIRGMAYPYGAYNDEIVNALKTCGIAYARTTRATLGFDIPSDWLRMPATCHHSHAELFNLADKFLDKHNGRQAWLFYVWGHTYEFDTNAPTNNWEYIEEFAKKISGHEDVWYATNMEIYEYIKAYHSLEWSADGRTVYNPGDKDVWVGITFDKNICVKSGETVKI